MSCPTMEEKWEIFREEMFRLWRAICLEQQFTPMYFCPTFGNRMQEEIQAKMETGTTIVKASVTVKTESMHESQS